MQRFITHEPTVMRDMVYDCEQLYQARCIWYDLMPRIDEVRNLDQWDRWVYALYNYCAALRFMVGMEQQSIDVEDLPDDDEDLDGFTLVNAVNQVVQDIRDSYEMMQYDATYFDLDNLHEWSESVMTTAHQMVDNTRLMMYRMRHPNTVTAEQYKQDWLHYNQSLKAVVGDVSYPEVNDALACSDASTVSPE